MARYVYTSREFRFIDRTHLSHSSSRDHSIRTHASAVVALVVVVVVVVAVVAVVVVVVVLLLLRARNAKHDEENADTLAAVRHTLKRARH